jgi:hypothetical protein
MVCRVSHAAVVLLSSCLLAGSSGCSFVVVEPVSPRADRSAKLTCTSDQVPPVIDTVIAFASAASTLYAAKDAGGYRAAATGLGLAFSGVWLGSAAYGFVKTDECEKARARIARPLGVPAKATAAPPNAPASAEPVHANGQAPRAHAPLAPADD